jgi:chromosome segregation ATPase
MNLPIANIRQDRHAAAYVSLGRSRPDLKPVMPASPRTAAQILAERDAAQAEREALEASRPDVLLNGTTDDVAALDHRIAVTKIRLDQLQVQHAAALIAEAQAQAAHETEQKRRKDLHRKAVKASAEVEKLAAEYVAEAQRLVPLLAKIRERAALIEAANFALPDGADPVPPGEPRCSWEDRPDQPHSSIASRVRLPGLDRATPIW